jgi:UDP-glucose 4-epimerase
MKKVLVIGTHSYIGQKFNEYVSNSEKIDLVIDSVSGSDGTWRLVDFSQYDVILHLSAIVHRKESKKIEQLYYKINHDLAVEVAKKSKENHVRQFIFMSTAAVFSPQAGCIKNDTEPNPKTYYGKSKLLAEQDIIKLQNKDFKVVILRPPMIYGSKCTGNYFKLVKIAKYTPIFPEFHNKRSMLFIDTLSSYLVQLIVNEDSGYFHPQDDEYVDICELVVRIRSEMGKKTKLIRCLNMPIRILKDYNSLFNKVFGDMYYIR